MLKLNKEQRNSINDIINEIADGLTENPTASDFKELIEFLYECGREEEKEKILKDEYINEHTLKNTMPMFDKEGNAIITYQTKGFNRELLNKGTLIKISQHIRMGITPDLNGYYIVNKTNTDILFCIKKDDLKEYMFDIKDFTHIYPSGITELSLEIIELN